MGFQLESIYDLDAHDRAEGIINKAWVAPTVAQPKRKRVEYPCSTCYQAGKDCDIGRPCARCIKYGIAGACRDWSEVAVAGPSELYQQRAGDPIAQQAWPLDTPSPRQEPQSLAANLPESPDPWQRLPNKLHFGEHPFKLHFGEVDSRDIDSSNSGFGMAPTFNGYLDMPPDLWPQQAVTVVSQSPTISPTPGLLPVARIVHETPFSLVDTGTPTLSNNIPEVSLHPDQPFIARSRGSIIRLPPLELPLERSGFDGFQPTSGMVSPYNRPQCPPPPTVIPGSPIPWDAGSNVLFPRFTTPETPSVDKPRLGYQESIFQVAQRAAALGYRPLSDAPDESGRSQATTPTVNNQLSTQDKGTPTEQLPDDTSIQRRKHYGSTATSANQAPPRFNEQRDFGVNHGELPNETISSVVNQDKLTSNATVEATAQLTTQVISHTMPLVAIIEHLVNQGCPDVSSHLTNIDEHSRYSGSLSDVYQARWPDGSLVAVKCLRALSSSDVPPGKLLKHTARELYAWSRASHPNILKLHGLALVRGKLAMIAPWMEYSSLLAYIRARPTVDRCSLCTQVARGLSYMHNLGLVHGDVKGNNIVVSEDGVAKITDFGSTTMTQEFAIAFTATQTTNYSIRWAAPELFRSQSLCFESDVYAFAKTVLEALTGDIPHKDLNDFAIMRHVGFEGKLPDRPLEHIPPQSKKGDELWSMLVRCWDLEPAQRPTISEICKILGGITQEDLRVLD